MTNTTTKTTNPEAIANAKADAISTINWAESFKGTTDRMIHSCENLNGVYAHQYKPTITGATPEFTEAANDGDAYANFTGARVDAGDSMEDGLYHIAKALEELRKASKAFLDADGDASWALAALEHIEKSEAEASGR